jgi:endonuclease I
MISTFNQLISCTCLARFCSSLLIMNGWRNTCTLFEHTCLYTGEQLLLSKTFSREHIVPVSRLKQVTPSAAQDLHNVWPSHVRINNARSNYRFVNMCTIGQKDWYIDKKTGIFVPPHRAQGVIARTALYMKSKYPELNLDQIIDSRALQTWQLIPPTKYELRHHARAAHFHAGQFNTHVWDALHICKKYRINVN